MVMAVTVNTAVLRARGASIRRGGRRATRHRDGFVTRCVAIVVRVVGYRHGRRLDRAASGRDQRVVHRAIRLGRHHPAAADGTVGESMAALGSVAGGQRVAARGPPRRTRRARSSWASRAPHWRTLLVATLVFVLLFALPWQLTSWRPQLPATWVEPAAAALRLGLVLLLGLVGAAVMIIASVGTVPAGRSSPPDRQPHD